MQTRHPRTFDPAARGPLHGVRILDGIGSRTRSPPSRRGCGRQAEHHRSKGSPRLPSPRLTRGDTKASGARFYRSAFSSRGGDLGEALALHKDVAFERPQRRRAPAVAYIDNDRAIVVVHPDHHAGDIRAFARFRRAYEKAARTSRRAAPQRPSCRRRPGRRQRRSPSSARGRPPRASAPRRPRSRRPGSPGIGDPSSRPGNRRRDRRGATLRAGRRRIPAFRKIRIIGQSSGPAVNQRNSPGLAGRGWTGSNHGAHAGASRLHRPLKAASPIMSLLCLYR
jgi:hypothetical protein